MQPFSIICQSCAAKLKVRQPNAIGQRLGCPKCGQMLKVIPPADWQPPSDLPPDVQKRLAEIAQPTQSFDFEDMDAIIASANQQPTGHENDSKQKESEKNPNRLSPEEAVKAVRQQAKGQPSQTKQSKNNSVSSNNATEPSPLLPNAQWTSQAEKQRRKVLTVSAAIVAGLLVIATITTIFLINRPSKPNLTKNDSDDVSRSDEEGELGDNISDRENEISKHESDDPSTKNNVDESQAPNAGNDEVNHANLSGNDPNATNPNLTNPQPEILPNQPPAQPPEIPGAGQAQNATDQSDSNVSPQDGFPDNPMIDIGKPTIDLNTTNSQSPLSPAAIFDGIVATSPQLSGYEAIFESSGTSLSELENIADASERIELGTPKYYIESPAPRKLFLEKVLETQIKGIRYEEIPFTFLLNELSRLGIAWDLDTQELAAQGFDFSQNVKLDLADVSLKEIYEDIANQLDLTFQTSQTPFPILTFGPKNKNSIQETSHAFPFDKNEALKKFGEMIPQLIAPNSWPENAADALKIGGQQVTVKSTPLVQHQVSELANALTAVAEYNSDPLDIEKIEKLKPLPLKLEPILKEPLTLEPQLRIPLWVLLEKLEENANIKILVDWSEAAKSGWTPETTVPGNMIEPDIQSLLKHLCHSLDMTWVIVDEKTIEITSHEQAATRVFIAVYPFQRMLSEKVTADDVKSFVFGTVLGKQIRRPNVRILDQVETLSFIVVAPQTVHQKIAPIMAKLRGEQR